MTLNSFRSAVALATALFTLGATLMAHQIVGTVVTASPSSITISVVDETTKTATFDLNKDTKIMRGTKTVTFAEARIQKGEKISITIDHDLDEHLATIVKLDALKLGIAK